MLTDILDGVNRKLKELFGAEVVIYTDTVEQGLKEPCFLLAFWNHRKSQWSAGGITAV